MPDETTKRPHHAKRRALRVLRDCLGGYAVPRFLSLKALKVLQTVLRDNRLAFLEFHDELSKLAGRLPLALEKELKEIAPIPPVSASAAQAGSVAWRQSSSR